GTAQNGWFTFTVPVPSTTPAGTYTMNTLTLVDSADNQVTYPTWPGGISPPSFTVAKTADSTAPAVGPISFNPGALNVTQSNKNAAVDVHITDAVPGVDHGTITVNGPPGDSDYPLQFDNTNRKSGTASNGVYEITFPVDYTQAGTFSVSAVD